MSATESNADCAVTGANGWGEIAWDRKVGLYASLACVMEATAPKPGNVHRGADFADCSFADFALSGLAIAPALERLARGEYTVGPAVLAAVQAMRTSVNTNTYLGTLLLLAPLVAVPSGDSLANGLPRILSELTANDAAAIYAAIRLAAPGGLGTAPAHDVQQTPPASLLEAMSAAAERDRVARQFVTGFGDILNFATPVLLRGLGLPTATPIPGPDFIEAPWTLQEAIVWLHVRLLAEFSDSLIARKCGPEAAAHCQHLARLAIAAPDHEAYGYRLGDLDFWLRAAGNSRNPGTTADLVAATLFVVLREGWLPAPWRLWPPAEPALPASRGVPADLTS